MVALLDGDALGLVACRVLDRRLGQLDVAVDDRRVDLAQRDRKIGEDGEAVRRHVGEAAAHVEILVGAAALDRHLAGPQRRQERRVVLQHGELALRAGGGHRLDLTGEQELLRRHELELEGGHDLVLSSAPRTGAPSNFAVAGPARAAPDRRWC